MNKDYFKAISEMLLEVQSTQEEQMDILSEKIAETIIKGNNIYAFGCSHAGILTQELFYRTGGLAVINPILAPGLSLTERPVTITTDIERIGGYAKIIVEQNNLKSGDLLILHSVSGRNPVTVEVAIEAGLKGVYTACVTNLKYTKSVSSRVKCGKKLYEVCDLVIDNCGHIGDAVCEVEGFSQRVGASSTVIGAALLNSVVVNAVESLIKKGEIPPVFISANVEKGEEHNALILLKYKNNIKYMI